MAQSKKGRPKKTMRDDAKDVVVGVGKELALVGLHGVKELTGVDLHRKPKKGKEPWEKKWGEK